MANNYRIMRGGSQELMKLRQSMISQLVLLTEVAALEYHEMLLSRATGIWKTDDLPVTVILTR